MAEALVSSSLIDQAVGILMAQQRCGAGRRSTCCARRRSTVTAS
jgi:hypothetical protein